MAVAPAAVTPATPPLPVCRPQLSSPGFPRTSGGGGGACAAVSHSALMVPEPGKNKRERGEVTLNSVTPPRPRLRPPRARSQHAPLPRRKLLNSGPRDPEPQSPQSPRGERAAQTSQALTAATRDPATPRPRDPRPRDPAPHQPVSGATASALRPAPRRPPRSFPSGPIRSHPVMAARLLLLTLAPLACTLTSEPAPRFRNLRLVPNELRLSWDSDITSGPWEVACRKGEESPVWAPTGHTYCTFLSLSLCHVTNFSVFLRGDPGSTAQIRFPESDPDRALAATDLRCWVHDVDVMTCRWGRGPGAPKHAQYRMFWRKAALGRDQDRECTHYDVTDPWGVRLGCRVDGVAALPTHVTVTVSGGGGASCSDISVDLQRVEVLTPPELSAACNGSEDARLRWEMRSHFHHGFQYELQINKSSHLEPEMEKTSENHFRVLISGSASFRIRAKPQESARFSDWSPAVRLDCAPARKHVTVMAAALAALGAGLTVLVTLLLCRRHLRAKLFPQIPRVKDPRGVAETETVTWSAAPEDPEVTFVTEA